MLETDDKTLNPHGFLDSEAEHPDGCEIGSWDVFRLDMDMEIRKLHEATCRACEVLYIALRAEENTQ